MNNHGGGCCGMRHTQGYSASYAEAFTRLTRELQDLPRGRLLEIVLTDDQLHSRPGPNFGNLLANKGFKLVSRFRNGNTENICNVFHYHTDPLPVDGLPFPMNPAAVVERVWRSIRDEDFDYRVKNLRINNIRSSLHRRETYQLLGRKTKFFYWNERVRTSWDNVEIEDPG